MKGEESNAHQNETQKHAYFYNLRIIILMS